MGLTNAEKQARFRAKRAAEVERLRKEAKAPPPDAKLIEQLRQHINELEAELARERAEMPRTREEFEAAKRAATEARKAKRAAARAAAAEMYAEDEATLQEKLRSAEKQLTANKTTIKNLKAKVQYLTFNPPPARMSRRLHRQVLGWLHPDRAYGDDTQRKKLEKCFQEFNAIKFKLPDDERA